MLHDHARREPKDRKDRPSCDDLCNMQSAACAGVTNGPITRRQNARTPRRRITPFAVAVR